MNRIMTENTQVQPIMIDGFDVTEAVNKGSSWDTRRILDNQYREKYPQPEEPKWKAPEVTHTPRVVRHTNGRVWTEIEASQYASSKPTLALNLVIGDNAHTLMFSEDQLTKLREEIDRALAECHEQMKAAEAHSASYSRYKEVYGAWDKRRDALLKKAEEAWETLHASEQRGDGRYDDDDYEDDNDDE
jgi:hypothetical protein